MNSPSNISDEIIQNVYDNWTLEQLAEEANQAAGDAERQKKASETNMVAAGRMLAAAKSKVKHGEWAQWLEANWKHSQRWASECMRAAGFRTKTDRSDEESAENGSDDQNGSNFHFGSTADDQRARQPDLNSLPSNTKPEKPLTQPANQKVRQPERRLPERTSTPEFSAQKRPSPSGNPNAERAHAERQLATASKDVDPVVAVMTAVKAIRECVSRHELQTTDRRRCATHLRKVADEMDPPSKGVGPTLQEVQDYAAEQGWDKFDAEQFWNHYELTGWTYGQQKRPLKKWKIAAAQAWRNGTGWCVKGFAGSKAAQRAADNDAAFREVFGED